MMKYWLIVLLLKVLVCKQYPTVVFHGLNDNCKAQQGFVQTLQLGMPNTYIKCLETGADYASIVGTSIKAMAKLGCLMLQQDNQLFNQTINVVGQSQGSMIARYIVQKCDLGPAGKVDTLVTVGGPNMGVAGVPECPTDNTICHYLDMLIGQDLIYTSLIQNLVAPAGYYKDPHNLNHYLSTKTFLAQLNNEVDFDQQQKDRLQSLRQLVLVMFTLDTVVIPKESEWFQYYAPGTDTLLDMIIKTTIDRPHMHLSSDDIIDNVLVYIQ